MTYVRNAPVPVGQWIEYLNINECLYLLSQREPEIPRTYIAHQAEHRVLCWNRTGVKDFKEEVLDWS